MNRIEIHNKLHYYLGILIAFSLPFKKFTPILIVLLLLNWLIEGNLVKKIKKVTSSKYALLFVGFYFLHVIGLTYTTNMDAAWFDLEVKLSLLIFPLLIASKPYNKKEVSHLFIALTVGLVYSSVYMLTRSFSLYFTYGENTFFYEKFAVFVHTSYISMYLNIAICWLLISLFKKKQTNYLFTKAISLVLIVFFSVIVVLLASKTGILTLLLIVFGLIIYTIFIRKKYAVGVSGVAIFLISIFVINSYVPNLKSRVDNFVQAFTTNQGNDTFNSTAIRMLIWESSAEVVKNNFILGVGTGDIKNELRNEYEKRGITNALEQNFNAHNEFLQVFVTLGVVGFLVLLLSLIFPLIKAVKTKSYLYLFFLLIVAINFFSESMLETQAGVLFYAFFNSVLCFEIIKDKGNL